MPAPGFNASVPVSGDYSGQVVDRLPWIEAHYHELATVDGLIPKRAMKLRVKHGAER